MKKNTISGWGWVGNDAVIYCPILKFVACSYGPNVLQSAFFDFTFSSFMSRHTLSQE